ncbi:MAG: hypothetical protein HC923_04570 [Myxococcales bacterium]|nr:hypothetical protein [Myxococcales bacterium]
MIAVTRPNDVPFFERGANGRTIFLGWGADVLRLGSWRADRDIDVLRVGRQPRLWADDEVSAARCRDAGLSFHGRPPDDIPLEEMHVRLMPYYARTKFVLAQTNRIDDSPYTHPKEEYVTGRWMDALAGGATVAGVQPTSDRTMEELFWPGAVLDFPKEDVQDQMERLRHTVSSWSPDIAVKNHRMALERLDWRWRLKELTERLSLRAPKLDADLDEIRSRIAEHPRENRDLAV